MTIPHGPPDAEFLLLGLEDHVHGLHLPGGGGAISVHKPESEIIETVWHIIRTPGALPQLVGRPEYGGGLLHVPHLRQHHLGEEDTESM